MGFRILVVLDERGARERIGAYLGARGHQVDQAADGFAALTLLERHRFDLMVAATDMAVMSGLDLVRVMRDHHPGIRIIALLRSPTFELTMECIRLGIEDCADLALADLDDLGTAVDRSLAQASRWIAMLRRSRRSPAPAGGSP